MEQCEICEQTMGIIEHEFCDICDDCREPQVDYEEIRSDLNQIDTFAGVVSEWLDDNHDEFEPNTEEITDLSNQLSELMYTITKIQEKQNWI